MTVRLHPSGVIELSGDCPSADAETLLRHLLEDPTATVDWRCCAGAHAAVVQVLIAASPNLQGPPANDFLAQLVEPAIKTR